MDVLEQIGGDAIRMLYDGGRIMDMLHCRLQ